MVQLEAALEPEHFHALFLRQPPLVLGAWLPIGEPPPVAPSMPLLPAADAACRPALACPHIAAIPAPSPARPRLLMEQVVGETPDMVAVCKPHGMPVHAAGQYRKNTVLGILTAERPDLGPLLPVHRQAWHRLALLGERSEPAS